MKSLLERLHFKRGNHGRRGKVIHPPHLFDPVRFPYGPFKFKTGVPKDVSYEIEATTNLNAWGAVFSGKATGDLDFVDSNASKFSYRFYRLNADGVLSDNVIGYVTVTLPPGF